MNIDNLLRQHKEIYAILNSIKEMICRNDFQDNYTEFARSISHLAGKLQIHLNTEDKFLYPKLLENKALEYKTRKYIDEISIFWLLLMNLKINSILKAN